VLTSGGGSRSRELPVGRVDVSHRTPLLVSITRAHAQKSSNAVRLQSKCVLAFRQGYEEGYNRNQC
jgi:hypothetical protein